RARHGDRITNHRQERRLVLVRGDAPWSGPGECARLPAPESRAAGGGGRQGARRRPTRGAGGAGDGKRRSSGSAGQLSATQVPRPAGPADRGDVEEAETTALRILG